MSKKSSSEVSGNVAAGVVASVPITNQLVQMNIGNLKVYTIDIESALAFAKTNKVKHNVLIEIFGNLFPLIVFSKK